MLKAKLLGATAAAEVVAIEDVFSTYLFTGTGAALTINNGIDLAGEGGLVWQKSRTNAAYDHNLFDTARGVTKKLLTNTNLGEITETTYLTAFNANGFSVGSDAGYNQSGAGIVTWTFRQAPRFFDVVTYTGTGANRTIAHDLGVVPGCIIVKRTDTTGNWQVYHRSLANTEYLVLNSTAAKATGATRWNSTTPTSSVFSLGTDATVNASGGTYVAYLFAHDPLGPSGDGSDGLIACGLHTQAVTGANELINLGWEPQWVLTKMANSTDDWILVDNMRGFLATGNSSMLRPNLSNVEGLTSTPNVASNGFIFNTTAGQQHIYIAIRRGPMREPTVGTEIFAPTVYTGTNVDNRLVNTGLLTDMAWVRQRDDSVLGGMVVGDRMRGQPYLLTGTTAAELSDGDSFDQQIVSTTEYGTAFSSHVGFYVGNDATSKLNANTTSNNHIAYSFRRAPGFFDVVAYTGNGANRTISHNLGAVPELMIVKKRSAVDNWTVYAGDATDYLILNTTAATADLDTMWNDTAPTSSVFSLGTNDDVNGNTATFIAYLFASLPGISKVGSYTGNGSNQTINCGFTTGARFILIKRTDSTGDWYVWDTARGIVTGNDPHLSLNTTAAEVTTDDTIDPDNSGFIVNQVAATNVNVNAASYIYLAIA